jgi:hypothetical protein
MHIVLSVLLGQLTMHMICFAAAEPVSYPC